MNRHSARLVTTLTLAAIFLLSGGAARAETEIMLLLDASASMSAPGAAGTSHTKFDEIRSALTTFFQALPADIAVGLRIVGGSPAADCYSSYLCFAPSTGNRSRLQDYLETIEPAGVRALYQGLEDALTDFSGSDDGADRVVLVITDGGDECGRDFETLSSTYVYSTATPRVVIYGLDLTNADRDTLGSFAGDTGGRLVSIDWTQGLSEMLIAFCHEFSNNLRIHLQDSNGNAVEGDIVVRDTTTDLVIAEELDIADFSMSVPPGTYEVTGRYLGQELRSDSFTVDEQGSRTISLEFDIYVEPFILILTDLYEQPLRARVTFLNSMNEPVLTTGIDSRHRVELPPDTYTIEIRAGDFIHDVYGVQIGPAFEPNLEVEVPVELSVLEVEVANMYGMPLNARVTIYDQDGSIIDEAPSTSYLYSHLPPGNYRVTATFEEIEVEETVYVYPGEQRQVALEINVALGDIYVSLRTESGNDVWGWVRLYDSRGNLIERFDRERVESPDWYFIDVPVGTYRIEAEADNITRVVTGVEVRENEETEVDVTFPDETY